MESVDTSVTEAVAKALSELGVGNGKELDLDSVRQKIAEKMFREYCPLRQARKHLEMTIGEVAEDSGLSKVTVSHYEAGYPQAAAPALTNLICLFRSVAPYSDGAPNQNQWIAEGIGNYTTWYMAGLAGTEDQYIRNCTSGEAVLDSGQQ